MVETLHFTAGLAASMPGWGKFCTPWGMANKKTQKCMSRDVGGGDERLWAVREKGALFGKNKCWHYQPWASCSGRQGDSRAVPWAGSSGLALRFTRMC